MNKYGHHIPNAAYMANMQQGHMNLAFLHMYAKPQPTATSTSHVITKYVPDTNMAIKLDTYTMYAQNLMYISRVVCTYMCHI